MVTKEWLAQIPAHAKNVRLVKRYSTTRSIWINLYTKEMYYIDPTLAKKLQTQRAAGTQMSMNFMD
jgi:hypothetical protein